MEKLIQELLELKHVKGVKRQNNSVLKLELFTKEIKGSEASKIRGDMRKITPSIRKVLEENRKKDTISNWEWIVRPEKQYQETKLGKNKVSDRKDAGYKPSYYRVSIRE